MTIRRAAAHPIRSRLAAAAVASIALAAGPAAALDPYEGWLCCNLWTDGSWITDINYRSSSKTLLPAGTKVKVTGLGRYRVYIELEGKKQAIGNDYSRSVDMEAFARRSVLASDPAASIARWPAAVREAVKAGKVMRGMTREQVLTALGYPTGSYTPELDGPLWRYWLDRSSEFQVFWDEDERSSQ